MSSLLLQPTPTAQWQALLHEAQTAARCRLETDLESYLVFLLIRFTDRPELADAVLALEFLNSVTTPGRLGQDRLRDVGDQCLLYSGLFPRQAERRHVQLSYFVDMGRTAYQQLSDTTEHDADGLYAHLAQGFVSLMDVLHMVRELGTGHSALDPLMAAESWSESGSEYALRALRQVTDATLMMSVSDTRSRSHH
jgi:hypothetical protein